MSSRVAKLVLIVGVRGCGKTTFVEKLISGKKEHSVVCTPHLYEWQNLSDTDLAKPADFTFSGAKRHIIKHDYTLERLKFFTNGTIVFDDCKVFLPANPQSSEGKEFTQFLIDGRHKAVDFICVAHGLTQISPLFFPYVTDIILFQTGDSLQLCRNKLLNFNEIQAMQSRVNAKATQNRYYCEHFKFS
jgi:GTPase SAR1 family protein